MFTRPLSALGRITTLSALCALAMSLCSTAAQAVPSFARQTGMDCAGCHIGAFGPQLTPAGIRFKLGGYTETDGKSGKNPLSAMVVASMTRTQVDQDPAPDHLKANNNAVMDQASLFVAGRLTDQIGSFVQITHSGVDHSTSLDELDVRWARTVPLGDKESIVGVSVNNNPSIQDPFNTTPVWRFPYVSPSAGFGTGEAASLINGGLSQRVLGASAYLFWNDSVYAELGSYRSISPTVQKNILGVGEDFQRLGANAYWRLAYFKDLKAQNFSVGVFGWNARVAPDRNAGTPEDQHRNVGVDGSYQFLGTREHVATVNASHTRANMTSGETGEPSQLKETHLNLSYHYRNTWGATVGAFDTRGSDPVSATRGQIVQMDWTPWGKEDAVAPAPFSIANLRLALQYWRYDRFAGETTNASDHNTVSLIAWTSF